MLFENDEILKEQWALEERERRIREEGKKPISQSKDKKGILQKTKKQRNIESGESFGYVISALNF